MKQFDAPAPPGANGGVAEGEEDEEWTTALQMMGAVEGGLNLQLGRTVSLQPGSSSLAEGGGLAQMESLAPMSPGMSQYVLLENSMKEVRAKGMEGWGRGAWAVGGRRPRAGHVWIPSSLPLMRWDIILVQSPSPLREEASVGATKQLVAMARKTELLRRQQQEIERQVNER